MVVFATKFTTRLLTTAATVVSLVLALATDATSASFVGNVAAAVPRNATVARNLGTGTGYVAACYAPFHNAQYPLNGGSPDIAALRQAIDDDFRHMSQHLTHVRTYYAQHYGIEVAPIAAKYGIKLYIGAFLTKESWWSSEVSAVVSAVNAYPDTIEAVLVGNENMANWYESAAYILGKVNEIKRALGSSASRVKFGTVQRITEYVDPAYDSQFWALSDNLDILGVNIYPFFSNGYDTSKPVALLDAQWNTVANKYPRSKLRLTETGFPTRGSQSSTSPPLQPSVWNSVNYYEALVDWTPSGYAGLPKFWFQAFDRREDDSVSPDYERYFGFFTTGRAYKQTNFPHFKSASPTPAPTTPGACRLQDGVDFTGNDIGNVLSTKAEPCCDVCRAMPGCRAFTWSVYNGGTCWLKSGKGTYKTGIAGVTSAEL